MWRARTLSVVRISSSNGASQIDCPPLPVPVGSPVWIMKSYASKVYHNSEAGETDISPTYGDDAMKDNTVVVATLSQLCKVFACLLNTSGDEGGFRRSGDD